MYFLMLQDFENLFPTQTRDFVYFSTSVFSLVIFLDYEFSLSHLVCAVPCCLCVIIFKDYVQCFLHVLHKELGPEFSLFCNKYCIS